MTAVFFIFAGLLLEVFPLFPPSWKSSSSSSKRLFLFPPVPFGCFLLDELLGLDLVDELEGTAPKYLRISLVNQRKGRNKVLIFVSCFDMLEKGVSLKHNYLT